MNREMNMSEAADFLAESEALHAAVSTLGDEGFRQKTQFKNWSIDDVLVHLHFWNGMADLSANDEQAFRQVFDRAMAGARDGSLREFENAEVRERGAALREAWIARARDMAPRWAAMDPKTRLPWVGPTMSARSSITARQMETWAHGFEIFDCLGLERTEDDRIRNIVVLGVNTFGWSHTVHGLAVPQIMPKLELVAPSGVVWEFGDPSAGRIAGPAVDFAAVVTQTRALADTGLTIEGAVARNWMAHAQCFAGSRETPPPPGTRHRKPAGAKN